MAVDLRTISGVYHGATGCSAIYYGSTKIYPNTHYIDNGTTFYNISTSFLPTGGKITNTAYTVDQSGEITSQNDVINCIDIDWNDGSIGTFRNIQTTGDVLAILDEIGQGITDLGGSSFDWENSDRVYVTDAVTHIPIGQHPRYLYITGDITDNYINPSSARNYGRSNSDGVLEWAVQSGYANPQLNWYVDITAVTRMYHYNTSTQQYERWIPMENGVAQYQVKYRLSGMKPSIQAWYDSSKVLYLSPNREAGSIAEMYVEYVGPDGVTYASDFNIKAYRNL